MSCSVTSSSATRSGDTITVKVTFKATGAAYYVQIRDDDGRYTSTANAGSVSDTITRTINSPGAGSRTYSANSYVQWQQGGSFVYDDSASVTVSWSARTYTITYNKGTNGTGTNTSVSKTYGVALTLKNAIFSRTGYTQTGWSTSNGGAKAYNLGASYTSNGDATLYPYWEANTYTITYNKGSYGTGTNTTDTKTYRVTKKLKGAIFTRSGYKQTGWSVNSNGSTKDYDLEANYSVENNITLYPFWEVSTILRLSNGTTIKEYTKLYFSDGTNVYNIVGCYFSDGTSTHQGV